MYYCIVYAVFLFMYNLKRLCIVSVRLVIQVTYLPMKSSVESYNMKEGLFINCIIYIYIIQSIKIYLLIDKRALNAVK